MRTITLFAVVALGLTAPAWAADGAPAKSAAAARAATAPKAKAAKPAKRPVAAGPAPATTRLKPSLVAPTTDVLHEHFAITVTGSVADADGMPLPGATIWKTNTREVLAVANSQGDFTVTLPSNAPIVLTCGFAGFQEQQLDMRQPRRLNQFVVQLEPTAKRR